MAKTPADVLKMVKDGSYEFIDLRFCDLPGQVQHFTIPVKQLTEDGFEEGYGFDGSSIRGFQAIQESDMLLIPDPTSAVDDPFRARKTLLLYCFVNDPLTGEPYDRDPRYVAKKAEAYLKSTGIADTSYWGPGSRVLHLRLGPLRPEPALGVLLRRFRGRRLELRPGRAEWQPCLQASLQRGLLSGTAHRSLPGSAFGDDRQPRDRRHRDRGSAPRGGYGRPGRDRHALRHPVADGGQGDVVQVHRQEHRLGSRQVRHVHAEAAVRGQRLGDAHPPIACGPTESLCSTTRPATPGCPTWPAGTSAAC